MSSLLSQDFASIPSSKSPFIPLFSTFAPSLLSTEGFIDEGARFGTNSAEIVLGLTLLVARAEEMCSLLLAC